jgi:hypothetical protein
MKHLKRRWDEERADEHADWGCSWWLFETDDQGRVLRQIEIYDNGPKKRYSAENPTDPDGMLAEHPLDLAEFHQCAITAQEFEAQWK